jgi:hypothetical protein
MTAVTAAVFALQAVAVLALPYLGRSTIGAAVCVTGFGLGFGVATIARPAILTDRYGITRYATIAATMTTPVSAAKALAPLAAAALSPNSFPLVAGAACLTGAALVLWSASMAGATGVHSGQQRGSAWLW